MVIMDGSVGNNYWKARANRLGEAGLLFSVWFSPKTGKRIPNLNLNTIRPRAALKQADSGEDASIKDLSKKRYPLENIDLSIYISGYFYV